MKTIYNKWIKKNLTQFQTSKKRIPYKAYSTDDVQKAISEVSNNRLSINKAADLYGVPRTTLKDKLSGRTPVVSTQGPKPVLTDQEESEIATWAINMSKIGYGRTKEEVLCVVQKLLEKNPRPNPFVNNKPGREWWEAFLRRNPSLTLRTPENLCKARAVSCTKEAIVKWFKDFQVYLSEEENCNSILSDPSRMFNADEAGFPLNPKCEGKVLAELGAKDVYGLSSSDRTQITVLACGNASGYLLPPMKVFPGERFKYNPLHGAVPNSFLGRSKNGWMDTEVFFMWVANHFVKHIPPVRPVILLVDGHSTHIDQETTKFCKDNGIILYCLPAHASHIIQPLDVAFFRPLKCNWRKAVKKYRDENPGQSVTKMVFSKVFKTAWDATNKPEILVNGFRDSGLYPLNPGVIDTGKFAPSLVFTQPPTALDSQTDNTPGNDHASEAKGSDTIVEKSTPATSTSSQDASLQLQPSSPSSTETISKNTPASSCNLSVTSKMSEQCLVSSQTISSPTTPTASGDTSVVLGHKVSPTFDGIISYPSVAKPKAKKRPEIPKALTSQQMINYLECKTNEKQQKEKIKEKRKLEREAKQKIKLEENLAKKIKQSSETKTKKTKHVKKTYCSVCKNVYEEKKWFEWIGCDGDCNSWFHVKCTDIDYETENKDPGTIQDELDEIEWFCDSCLNKC